MNTNIELGTMTADQLLELIESAKAALPAACAREGHKWGDVEEHEYGEEWVESPGGRNGHWRGKTYRHYSRECRACGVAQGKIGDGEWESTWI
jgi:hypothetical protein